MAKTFTAPFAQTSKTGIETVTTATPALITTAGVDGAIFTSLSALPAGTVTASRLRLLLSKDSGVTKEFIRAAVLAAYTEDTTTAPTLVVFDAISESTPIRLEAGDELYIETSTAQASGVTFFAEWTDY